MAGTRRVVTVYSSSVLHRLVWTLALASFAANALNVTRYRVVPGGKLVMCGFYSIAVRMWASTDDAWLYLTEKECNEQTASPCSPSANGVLAPLACLGQPACERETDPPPGVPFCLVVVNMNASAPLDLDLQVSGSYTPVASGGGGGGGGGGFGGTEIALICLGAGTALFMVSGLITLFSWLRRGRRPPRSKQASAGQVRAGGSLGGFGTVD
ncbi:hypothetical protein GPECTOR_4g596 [Gonium pectorale]|uniref:Uncharacterized protein n=1 Tax=Gonium pectorale TaxID=33097 RepID=A0A150GXI2_GONPE|nr:hypothetical protein GPECTOR_4g596 [Gonium pectorale]|eukprot:KXZ54531.1 hypothetical protein GPECTOR_4g596 [Gonium pectorale]